MGGTVSENNKPSRIVTREDVSRILREWVEGGLSSVDIHSWAESLFMHDGVGYEDWEHDDKSVTNEVLGALDMLDMNLILPEDVPIYLEFLDTPEGQFDAGYALMEKRLEAVDFVARSVLLRDVRPYSLVLQSQRSGKNEGKT